MDWKLLYFTFPGIFWNFLKEKGIKILQIIVNFKSTKTKFNATKMCENYYNSTLEFSEGNIWNLAEIFRKILPDT